MDGLIVYGKGFMFSAKILAGMVILTKLHDTTIRTLFFFPKTRQAERAAHVNIRIRVNRKETADPSEDMQTDMKGYKKEYPEVKFADLAVSQSKYKISARLFYVQSDFYEYVVYVDPGPGVMMNFSLSWKDSKAATPEEMKAFQSPRIPILDMREYSPPVVGNFGSADPLGLVGAFPASRVYSTCKRHWN